ncbi:LacI family DNA-binding transcriptional regulator [Steroidobacter sp.]|uniref:LacI family DNA-binding transcriptional regulator n=1 Tax=Steroidobacter sp. TaxID=1978227 RepID=UPI001A3E5337|nr:LacI family DNA-binding transcriptional regulator [Steroidobacter sp.]MBL8268177.1 LacI family DNA-binding transcriptional regulator [Steroidobacter sp.]
MANIKPASSVDVARLAGVSQSAVSRTFTPGASISSETKAKVMAAAEALNYRPSLIPRIMLKNRSNIVAVIVGTLTNSYHSRALQAFAGRLQQQGKQVMLVQTNFERALDEVAAELACYRVDAVVSPLEITSAQVAEALDRLRIPVITLNSAHVTEWTATVSSDNEAAGQRIARLLLDRGGKRPGYIAGPRDSLSQQQREAGFRSGLAERGVNDCAWAQADYSYQGGYAAAREMFAKDSTLDCLFCVNDLVALGAMDALRIEFGKKIPDDVIIAGYDNTEAGAWPAYQLTTFDQRIDDMVGCAVSMLEREWEPRSQALITPVLMERASTRS